MRVKKSIGAMGAFLVAAVLFASFGSGRAPADETCVVVRQIAPVMSQKASAMLATSTVLVKLRSSWTTPAETSV